MSATLGARPLPISAASTRSAPAATAERSRPTPTGPCVIVSRRLLSARRQSPAVSSVVRPRAGLTTWCPASIGPTTNAAPSPGRASASADCCTAGSVTDSHIPGMSGCPAYSLWASACVSQVWPSSVNALCPMNRPLYDSKVPPLSSCRSTHTGAALRKQHGGSPRCPRCRRAHPRQAAHRAGRRPGVRIGRPTLRARSPRPGRCPRPPHPGARVASHERRQRIARVDVVVDDEYPNGPAAATCSPSVKVSPVRTHYRVRGQVAARAVCGTSRVVTRGRAAQRPAPTLLRGSA
jgi:hypothetical protein